MSAYPPPGSTGIGTHTLAVGDANGQVELRFERPVEWVRLDPETARQVAEQIARSSYKAKFGDTPTTQRRSVISDQKIATCRIRVRKMLETQFAGADPTLFSVHANAIVDAILQEVL